MPDERAILRVRRLLEEYGLGQHIFFTVNVKVIDRELTLKIGIVMDATLIAAPSSTKHDKGD